MPWPTSRGPALPATTTSQAAVTQPHQPRPGLPDAPPPIPQASQYWYFPGYRPSAEPGQQFWLPTLPNGQQFWVAGNMIASGEEYRDPDYVNNPQFDPGNPQTSLARMTEFYGPLQPVPLQDLRTQGAYLGDGPRTSYDQQRTIRTGPQRPGRQSLRLERRRRHAPDPRRAGSPHAARTVPALDRGSLQPPRGIRHLAGIAHRRRAQLRFPADRHGPGVADQTQQ